MSQCRHARLQASAGIGRRSTDTAWISVHVSCSGCGMAFPFSIMTAEKDETGKGLLVEAYAETPYDGMKP